MIPTLLMIIMKYQALISSEKNIYILESDLPSTAVVTRSLKKFCVFLNVFSVGTEL